MYRYSKYFHYENLYFFLLLTIAALLPTIEIFSAKLASLATIALSGAYLLSGNFSAKLEKAKNNKLLWLFCGLYAINIISLLYSTDLKNGGDILVRKLSLLLFPVIIATSPPLAKNQIHQILITFVASLIITSLYTFREGYTLLLNRDDLTDLVRLIPMHRPYMGLYCAFAIVILSYFIKIFKSWLVRALLLLFILYLLFYVYIIYVKITVVALLILTVAIAALYLVRTLKLYVNLALVALTVGFGVYMFNTNQELKLIISKIYHFEDFSYDEYDINLVSSINIRYINWGCSVSVLREDNNWVTGLGVGDTEKVLQPCYKDLNPWIEKLNMNSHNEFLEEMLRNGVLGLAILAACLFLPALLSLQKNDILYFSFILLIFVSCLTESILSRQLGIMFFAFFNALLAFGNNKYVKANT